ncbi:hypothetical protein ACGRHY_28725 [Streptomyces sp. HK10]|uniref:hypothetical protein n=1 Tax=Streptomyces sp. HK10 TaxID=3373255 RepID=UPI00374936BA
MPFSLTLPAVVATARRHCTERCFAYHASWRIFRRAGLKGHPGWHTGFYRRALTTHPLPAHGRVRVLICGASDEAMLATLARLLPPEQLEVHLIDACPTPLHLAAAYARRTGITLTTGLDRAPALTGCAGPYDVIVTDGLLSLLPTPGDRAALLARLADLLAPGGLVLYTARIAGAAGVLEYDRIGRRLQAATARALWPAPADQRRDLAGQILTRPSRPSPFAAPGQVRAAFTAVFGDVRCCLRRTPPTLALALAPTVRAGQGSACVGIAARAPRSLP